MFQWLHLWLLGVLALGFAGCRPSEPASAVFPLAWPPVFWSCDPSGVSREALGVCAAQRDQDRESSKALCLQWDHDAIWRLRCEAFIDLEAAAGLDLGTERSVGVSVERDPPSLALYKAHRAELLGSAHQALSEALSLAAAQQDQPTRQLLALSVLSVSLSLGDLDALSRALSQLEPSAELPSVLTDAALSVVEVWPVAALRLLNTATSFGYPLSAPAWLAVASLSLALHDDADAALFAASQAVVADPSNAQAAAALVQLSILSGDCSRISGEIQRLSRDAGLFSGAVRVWPSEAWVVLLLDASLPFDPSLWPERSRGGVQTLHDVLLRDLDPLRRAWLSVAKSRPYQDNPEVTMAIICAIQGHLQAP